MQDLQVQDSVSVRSRSCINEIDNIDSSCVINCIFCILYISVISVLLCSVVCRSVLLCYLFCYCCIE